MTFPNDPVFPTTVQGIMDGPRIGDLSGGLTKRELFAAMAMQGILSNITLFPDENGQLVRASEDSVARGAVMNADALIKALGEYK